MPKIKEQRAKQNITQQQLADELGFRVPLMSEIENGAVMLPQNKMNIACKFLNCSATDLYSIKELTFIKTQNQITDTQRDKITKLEQIISRKSFRLTMGCSKLFEQVQKLKDLKQKIKEEEKQKMKEVKDD